MDQFDVVQLKTVTRVKYLSGPRGYTTSPQGNWTVVSRVDNDVIIAKDNTLIRVPVSDVRVVAVYSIDNVMNNIINAGGQSAINMTEYLNIVFGWKEEFASSMLKKYGFPKTVYDPTHRDRIAQHIAVTVEENGEDQWV